MKCDETENNNINLTLNDRITIASGISVIIINDNEIMVKHGTHSSPSLIIRDTDLRGILGLTMSKLLNNDIKYDDLFSFFDQKEHEDLKKTIFDLYKRGIIVKSNTNPVYQYLKYNLNKETSLSSFTITIAGANTIGTEIAIDLLRSGIGHIILFDGTLSDGKSNAAQGSERNIDTIAEKTRKYLIKLGHTNSKVVKGSFDDYSQIEKIFDLSDFLVLSIDRPNPRIYNIFNRIALKKNKLWMISTIDGSRGIIGPTFIPFESACYGDYSRQVEAGIVDTNMYNIYRQFLDNDIHEQIFLGIPSYAKIIAGMTSLSVIHQLIRKYSFTSNRSIIIDFERMIFDTQDIFRLPRCPFCSRSRLYSSPARSLLEFSKDQ